MNLLEKALQKTIEKVEGKKTKKNGLFKCHDCGVWTSGNNHKEHCNKK